LLAVLAMALGCGGCSFSYQLDSMWGKNSEDNKVEYTGSVTPTAAGKTTAAGAVLQPGLPPEADLLYTRAAVTELLTKGAKDASVPWENPSTGARGTVTSIAAAYSSQDGFVCRDFLASYVNKGVESWLEGEACRIHNGQWEVRSMKPWKRS